MFDSLADRIRADEGHTHLTGELLLRWTAVLVSSILVFGGLYYAVRLLE